jgi:hypothetical protein
MMRRDLLASESGAKRPVNVDRLEAACLQDGDGGGRRHKANERLGGVWRFTGRRDSSCHQSGILNLAREWTSKIDAGRDNNLRDRADLHFNFTVRNPQEDVLGNIAL